MGAPEEGVGVADDGDEPGNGAQHGEACVGEEAGTVEGVEHRVEPVYAQHADQVQGGSVHR